MNTALLMSDEHDLDESTTLCRSQSPRSRELSSRDRMSARARYRRGKSASSYNGPHRRRQKRNYL